MIVLGNTMTTYAVLDPTREFLWSSWLSNFEELDRAGHEVKPFCAIQTDSRGIGLFKKLTDRLEALGGTYWEYRLDDGRTEVTGENRGRHLCTGLNLVAEYATSVGADYWLRVEADTQAPVDAIPKLLEVDNGLAAAACTTYFTYEDTRHWTPTVRNGVDVVIGPMTAACLLIRRGIFTRLKWRWSPDQGMTDDPAYSFDARTMLDTSTMTRRDCVALHFPPSIGPIDTRFPGLDMSVRQGE